MGPSWRRSEIVPSRTGSRSRRRATTATACSVMARRMRSVSIVALLDWDDAAGAVLHAPIHPQVHLPGVLREFLRHAERREYEFIHIRIAVMRHDPGLPLDGLDHLARLERDALRSGLQRRLVGRFLVLAVVHDDA